MPIFLHCGPDVEETRCTDADSCVEGERPCVPSHWGPNLPFVFAVATHMYVPGTGFMPRLCSMLVGPHITVVAHLLHFALLHFPDVGFFTN